MKPKFGRPLPEPKQRFITEKDNNISVGQLQPDANTPPSTAALSPPPPPATDGEEIMPIAKGPRQQRRRIGSLRHRRTLDQRVDLLTPKTQLV